MFRISCKLLIPNSRLIVRPNAVTNCTFHSVKKEDIQILEIHCIPGYNGGVIQKFHLEINRQNRTLGNFSVAESPQFQIEVSELVEEWQSDLQFVFYASNIKGRSDYTVYEHQLPKEMRTKMGTQFSQQFSHFRRLHFNNVWKLIQLQS